MERNPRKILVPVLSSASSKEITRDAFWLARYQSAQLCIVEVSLPVRFFKWVITQATGLVKHHFASPAEKAWRVAIEREKFACQVDTIEAPNLILGIVEAARKEESDTLVILPETGDKLGHVGLAELKRRLSEIRPCVLIRIGRGRWSRIEPCRKKHPLDFKVTPIHKDPWVV